MLVPLTLFDSPGYDSCYIRYQGRSRSCIKRTTPAEVRLLMGSGPVVMLIFAIGCGLEGQLYIRNEKTPRRGKVSPNLILLKHSLCIIQYCILAVVNHPAGGSNSAGSFTCINGPRCQRRRPFNALSIFCASSHDEYST